MRRNPRAGIRNYPFPKRPSRQHPAGPGHPPSALSLRMALAGKLGRKLHYSGVKVGRKGVFDVTKAPNYDNLRGVLKGAGYRLKRRPPKNSLH